MTGDVVVGVDLGTSGLKAVALSGDGCVAGQESARYQTRRPEYGSSEQDPGDWVAALRSVLARLSASVPSGRWRALGLSGMIPTLVALDSADRPVGPAITWEDSRAEAPAEDVRAEAGADRVYQVTGQWVDGRYLLAMFAGLAGRRPADAARAARIVGAKDYLLWWLTGQWRTDPSTAAGYGCYDLRANAWDPGIRAAAASVCGIAPELPGLAASDDLFPLRSARAAELGLRHDLPVVVGAADSVLAALGLGVRLPGDVAYVAGTSTVILGVSDSLVLDVDHRYLVTPLAGIEGWGLEMDLLATGSAIRWLADLFGCTEADLVALAGQCDVPDAPRFLPFLAPGEQGALWDPLLTGTLTDLGLGHGRPHLARALLAGIILESRRCLGLLAEATGRMGPVYVAGSSASAPLLRQDLADSSARAVVADSSFADYSALGAALLAARSVGLPVRDSGRRVDVVHEPRPSRAGAWRGLAARHEDLLVRMRGSAGSGARPELPDNG